MIELFANCEDPDQMPFSVTSDLSLHYLQNTIWDASRLQWGESQVTVSLLKRIYCFELKVRTETTLWFWPNVQTDKIITS